MRTQTLKKAIGDLLNEKLNLAFRDVTKADYDIFKIEYNWAYDGNNFSQYDENGHIIQDQYHHNIKYIPTALQSIIGQREEIPGIYINDITVPISMLVFNLDLLDSLEVTLNYFSDQTVGNVYELEVQTSGENKEKFKFSFTIDLPDLDNFEQLQGENAKVVVFQLSGTLTQQDLVYGNDIDYELSIDNGNNYEKLIRFNPGSSRHFNTFTDQKIGDLEQKSTEQDNLWTLTLDVLIQSNNSITYKLLPYTDERDYTKLGYSVDYLNSLVLKIRYNMLEIEIEKEVMISDIAYSASYGDYLILRLVFVSKINDINEIEEI